MHVHDRVSSGLNLTRPGVWGQEEAETTRRGYYVSASTLNDSASCFFAQRQLDDGPHLTNRTPHLPSGIIYWWYSSTEAGVYINVCGV